MAALKEIISYMKKSKARLVKLYKKGRSWYGEIITYKTYYNSKNKILYSYGSKSNFEPTCVEDEGVEVLMSDWSVKQLCDEARRIYKITTENLYKKGDRKKVGTLMEIAKIVRDEYAEVIYKNGRSWEYSNDEEYDTDYKRDKYHIDAYIW